MQFDAEIADKENENTSLIRLFKRWLSLVNDILLVPMFASLMIEFSSGSESISETSNIFFCSLFFTEWVLGLILTSDRAAYLKIISPTLLKNIS